MDHMVLSKVNGLVKKAQKLIIELKDKTSMYIKPNDENMNYLISNI